MKKSILVVLAIFNCCFLYSQDEGLKLLGNWSYSIDDSQQTVHIVGDKISNKASGGTSGTIKLSLYLTDSKYGGGSISGYALVNYKFDQLEGGYYYHDIDKVLNFDVIPPTDNYYVTLLLLEYTENGYIIRDYVTFDRLIAFDSHKTERVLNAIAEGLNNLSNSLSGQQQPSDNGSGINAGYTNNNYTTSSTRKCGYCNGTGACPYCNSAGQSKACVQNQFGVQCTDPYCVARNHRCKHCNGTHRCSNCNGTGYCR